jgi:hypothetical protein
VSMDRPALRAPDVQLSCLECAGHLELVGPDLQLSCLGSLKSKPMSCNCGHRELEWYIRISRELVQSLASGFPAWFRVLGYKTFSTSDRPPFMLNKVLFATLDPRHSSALMTAIWKHMIADGPIRHASTLPVGDLKSSNIAKCIFTFGILREWSAVRVDRGCFHDHEFTLESRTGHRAGAVYHPSEKNLVDVWVI